MIGSAVKADAQKKTARRFKEWAMMTLGTLLLASGVYFRAPSPNRIQSMTPVPIR